MSFLEYIENLRGRPEAERRRIVIWTSIVITAFIFALWLLNLRYLWQNVQEAPPVAAQVATSTQAASGGLGQAWSDAVIRIKTGWQTITNQN